VRLGDISSFLIQQGERRSRWELRQHDGVVSMEHSVIRQGFAKRYREEV
jgi:hypothetical protein